LNSEDSKRNKGKEDNEEKATGVDGQEQSAAVMTVDLPLRASATSAVKILVLGFDLVDARDGP
jgi:hypothetical protein